MTMLLYIAFSASGIACITSAKVLPRSFTITDATRNRDTLLVLYLPSPQFSCVARASCPTAFISGGYGGSHLGYSFIARALNVRGYLVLAVHPQLNTDAPMATAGDLYSPRMPVSWWGVENLRFLSASLSAIRLAKVAIGRPL